MRSLLPSLYYGLPSLRAVMFLIPPLYWFRREAARAILREVVALSPATLLEVGFSDAFLTRRLSIALPNTEITAIDTSEGSVSRARRLGLPNVRFLADDFFTHRGRYDVVVSMHVFVLFDHRSGLRKLRELGDTHVITLTGTSLFTRLHRPFHRFMTGLDVNLVEPEEYAGMAREEGFSVKLVKINDVEHSYLVVLGKGE